MRFATATASALRNSYLPRQFSRPLPPRAYGAAVQRCANPPPSPSSSAASSPSPSSYWLLLSKLLPPTGHWLLDALRDDRYYGVLVPLCMPITLVASYLGWFARKIFNHN